MFDEREVLAYDLHRTRRDISVRRAGVKMTSNRGPAETSLDDKQGISAGDSTDGAQGDETEAIDIKAFLADPDHPDYTALSNLITMC